LQTAQAFVAICHGMHCIYTHMHPHITRTRMLMAQKMIGVCVCGRKYVWQKITGLLCLSDRQKRLVFSVCVWQKIRGFFCLSEMIVCVRVWLRIRCEAVSFTVICYIHTYIQAHTMRTHTHTHTHTHTQREREDREVLRENVFFFVESKYFFLLRAKIWVCIEREQESCVYTRILCVYTGFLCRVYT